MGPVWREKQQQLKTKLSIGCRVSNRTTRESTIKVKNNQSVLVVGLVCYPEVEFFDHSIKLDRRS